MSAHQDECESRLKSVQHSQYQNNPAFSKALKHFMSLAVWYPIDGRTDKSAVFLYGRNRERTGCYGLLQDTFPTRILLS